ncbi:hypothetical protein DSO57_1020819 [Entomophthora muscae]|uniref:Uncharacterized protein n=1 Tax=Entomophthora muscae TaxID=34485 RepID=A0ACC2ST95_9FUNG|nr:hypothetical protein DSO57_1020819 [Entomophthora muscae]
MMMEAVLESSDNMVTSEQTRLQERIATSEARLEPLLVIGHLPADPHTTLATSYTTLNLFNYPSLTERAMKNFTIFNCLDEEAQAIIMPNLPECGAFAEKFCSERSLNNHKMDFVESAQTLISLKAAYFIDIKYALLNAVQPNKCLFLALEYEIYEEHNVSVLICHLLTFKDHFELPMSFTTRDSQENRYKSSTAETNKSKPAAGTPAPGSAATSGLRTCFKCEKLGHMSRNCKHSVEKVHHVGAEEYEYKDDCEDEKATHKEGPKNC